jgi:FlaA1/EpsC-like NDP-sugar epimerase
MQAGGLADGGEVFMLDMGEPVRIMDLARNMIRLAGFSVRDQSHPGGDIEIVQTGIRPGEKLVEELRLSDQALPTRHPSIAIVQEPYAPWDRLEPQLQRLRAAVDQRDDAQVRGILGVMVGGYNVEGARSASERRS